MPAAPRARFRHRQAGWQCRGPQPAETPATPRRALPLATPGGHVPDKDDAHGRYAGLSGSARPSRGRRARPGAHTDTDIDRPWAAPGTAPRVTTGAAHGRVPVARSSPGEDLSVPSRLLRTLVLAYKGISAHRSPACRFVPSCSDYALDALSRFGARGGLPLIVRRLVRCRPGGPFGFDPVPEVLLTGTTGAAGPDQANQGPGERQGGPQ
jgi:putative membrane protein insertion efficiency factor